MQFLVNFFYVLWVYRHDNSTSTTLVWSIRIIKNFHKDIRKTVCSKRKRGMKIYIQRRKVRQNETEIALLFCQNWTAYLSVVSFLKYFKSIWLLKVSFIEKIKLFTIFSRSFWDMSQIGRAKVMLFWYSIFVSFLNKMAMNVRLFVLVNDFFLSEVLASQNLILK